MTDRILVDAKDGAALLRISLRSFRDLIKTPGFPAARSLGPRSQRWLRAELEQVRWRFQRSGATSRPNWRRLGRQRPPDALFCHSRSGAKHEGNARAGDRRLTTGPRLAF